jgi:hypothetical protein
VLALLSPTQSLEELMRSLMRSALLSLSALLIFSSVSPSAFATPETDTQLIRLAPALKMGIGQLISGNNLYSYKGEILSNYPYTVFDQPVDLAKDYSKFYIGSRLDSVPKEQFLKRLAQHVEFIRDLMKPYGLKGYFVWASEDFEVAVLTWSSKEDADRTFSAIGTAGVDDAAKILKTLIFEDYNAK